MMKLTKMMFSAIAVGVSSLAVAGSISGSANVEFLAFDGQKVKKSTQLAVNDSNLHQVVVEVAGIVDSGSDGSYFSSNPIVITFNGTSENIQIIAPTLRTTSDVDKFKKSPRLTVQTVSGKEIASKQDVLKGEGFMPNANIVNNLAAYNGSNAVAAVPAFAVSQMQAIMPTNKSVANVKVTGENVAEQQLQYWFQQADKATQKRFLDWAKKQ